MQPTNHHPLVNIAIKAARLAGNIIIRAQSDLQNLNVKQKGINDFATSVDHAAEAAIIDTIRRAYPDHAILAEESGLSDPKNSDTTWIIDPLDGTTNFIHGYPHFCVSIGIKQEGVIRHGVVYDPTRDELFTASRGKGAQMNGRRLRVSSVETVDGALLGTGFPFREFNYLDDYLTFFKALIPNCAGIRRAGAAALDLAYVAAGRLDGFWEFGLKPWDIAAASLFVIEAGGWLTTIDGDNNYLEATSILAAPPKVHQQMLALYQKHFK